MATTPNGVFDAVPSSMLLSDFSEAQREEALKRFQVIRPFLEDGIALHEAIQEQGMSLRTARYWVSQYRQYGLQGLMRKPRADRGSYRQFSAELVQLVEGLALQKPRLSQAAIHRRVVEFTTARGETVPSYSSVYHLIQQLDPGLVMLAHEGSRAYRETFDLLHRREAKAPNEIWQADHTLLDIWIKNEKGDAAKPWLTVVMDDYSRALAGYFLSFAAPSAWQTALSLHQAIWHKAIAHWSVCGIPAVLYTDHGTDFTSRHLEQVSADLKIQLVFSQVGQPRGRGKIERFFETVNQLLLSHLPGYAPAGSTGIAPVLMLSELDKAFQDFLQTYHHRPHSATQIAPQARWTAQGFLPQMPASLEQLDLLLLTVAQPRKVHQDGIRFQGLRYIEPTLAAYVGEAVVLRYDPRDLAEVRVFHKNQFLCRAICPDLTSEVISLKDIVTARNQRRQALKKQLAERTSLVDALVGVKPKPLSSEQSHVCQTVPGPKTRLKRYADS
ncbi:MAG: Mu transposase C-terminal domain-containing protein (plasmid) [Leptolyngbya sp. BL-A-14]